MFMPLKRQQNSIAEQAMRELSSRGQIRKNS